MYCKDCKFWEPPSVDNMGFPILDETEVDALTGFGICNMARSKDGAPDNKDALAFARDYEIYTANLRTKAKFGCVQFKLKVVK